MVQERFAGKEIPASQYSDDDGSAPPELAGAIDSGDPYAVLEGLIGSRLLVPVVAVLDSVEEAPDGHRVEKDSHMASVTLVGPSGREALLAFTSTEHLNAWNPQARPVAVSAQSAAQAARDAGQALLIDIDRPHPVVIDGAEVESLAAGSPVARPWQREDVAAALAPVFSAGIAAGAFKVRVGSGDAYRLSIRVEAAEGVRLDLGRLEAHVAEALSELHGLERGVEVLVV